MKALRFALRMLRRDLRTGELQLLGVSLIVAVAAVTAVDFFTDRVERALELQAAELLAADLVIESTRPLPEELAAEAQSRGLRTASTLDFPSVVFQDRGPQLVQVKAVSQGYPLRGELRVSATRFGPESPASGIPARGTVWVEPRLLGLLQTKTGDRLHLGEGELSIGQVLRWEPDRGGQLFRLAPRVLLSLADIPATGLITPASRVHYRFLVAGDAAAVAGFTTWVRGRLPTGASIEDVGNARPEMRAALDQGGRFLGLATLSAVLLCGVAVALSTRRFVERQADTGAILRCLGASRRFVLQVFLLRLSALGVVAGVAGSLLGLLAQHLLALLIGEWLTLQLPPPSLAPLVAGIATAAITLVGFALAPALRLGQVSPLRVLRRDLGLPPVRFWAVIATALGALSLLLVWQAGDRQLALRVIVGSGIALVALLGAAQLLLRLLAPFRRHTPSLWRYGLAALLRSPQVSSLQLAGFGLGIMALLLVAVIRVDLLAAWEGKIPHDVPNHFLINIQPGEVEPLREHLRGQGIVSAGLYPMLRGRLVSISQRSVSPDDYDQPRARRLAAREFNLSWTAALPPDNEIMAGSWWGEGYRGDLQLSVEEGVAQTLGIRLGDRLTFLVAGDEVRAPVTSLRQVQWDSFRPNFFVLGSPGPLSDYPVTYITSFYLPPTQVDKLADLSKRFPSITVLDVTSLLRQVREIMDRGSQAVEYVFAFTLLAGLMVLYAGIQAGRELRIQESAVLRTLGLKRRQLLAAAASEFATLGLLAGLVAALFSTLLGQVLASQVLHLPYHTNPWVWLVGGLGGAIGICAAGLAAVLPLLRKPPIEVLRRA